MDRETEETTVATKRVRYTIRRETIRDAGTIIAQRRAILVECGHKETRRFNASMRAYGRWLRAKMRAGEYSEWFAVAPDGTVAAGAGLYVMSWHPVPRDIRGRRGYVTNVYTDPGHRRRGLAKKLMRTILAYCRERGFRFVVLHSSEAGMPLYEKLGFKRTTEMRKKL